MHGEVWNALFQEQELQPGVSGSEPMAIPAHRSQHQGSAQRGAPDSTAVPFLADTARRARLLLLRKGPEVVPSQTSALPVGDVGWQGKLSVLALQLEPGPVSLWRGQGMRLLTTW